MSDTGVSARSIHPMLRQVVKDLRPDELHFQSEISARSSPLLRDHRVFHVPVFPAAAYLDVALAASDQLTGEIGTTIVNVVLHDVLAFPTEESRRIRVRVRRINRVAVRFDIESAPATETAVSTWRHHAEGEVEYGLSAEVGFVPEFLGHETLLGSSCEQCSGEEFYVRADRGPFQWGTTHRVVRSVRRDAQHVVAELGMVEDAAMSDGGRRLHPTLLDGVLQIPAMEFSGDNDAERVAVPSRIDRVWLGTSSLRNISVHWPHRGGNREAADLAKVNLSVFGESGEPVADLQGLQFCSINREAFLNAMAARRSDSGSRSVNTPGAAPDKKTPSTEMVTRLKSMPSLQRTAFLTAYIEQNVVELLKLKNPKASDLERGFFSIGLDSLLAIELQFRLQKALDFSLPPGVGLNFKTMKELSSFLIEDILSLGEKAGAGTT